MLHNMLYLTFNWQNCLDKSGVVGTILMDLSKHLTAEVIFQIDTKE